MTNWIPLKEYFVEEDPSRMTEMPEKLRAAEFQGGGFGTPTLEVNGKIMRNNPPFEEISRQALS